MTRSIKLKIEKELKNQLFHFAFLIENLSWLYRPNATIQTADPIAPTTVDSCKKRVTKTKAKKSMVKGLRNL